MGKAYGKVSLRQLRKGAGFRSASAFAEAVGIPSSTYARYERDSYSIPLNNLMKLADWLDVPMDWIVGRTCEQAVARGAQQDIYDRLSARGRLEVDRFMAYQMWLDGKES